MPIAEPVMHIFDGSGSRALLMSPVVKSFRIVEVLDGEDWRAIPRSDVTVQGAQLVLSPTPSGAHAVWPKGKGTVRVKE